jgi:pantothenate kinase type III
MRMVVIDIGTTFIKCGRFEGNELKETWRYPTKDSATIGGELLSHVGNDQLAMSSVAPKAAADIEKAIKRPIFKVTPQAQNFIQDFHPDYGADRVADSVAARTFYAPDKNLAVFALGTCTVLTTVLASGVIDGGFIALGYHRMVAELQIASPLIEAVQEIDYKKYALDFGFTTGDQIINGAALAQIGIVERWLRLAREKLGEPIVTVATGGNAVLLIDQKVGSHKLVDYIDPDLTIKGIQLIASQNS